MFGRKHPKEEEGFAIDLPIIPMLDMSFQLLAFFVMTFKPPSSEGQISMKLPAIEQPANQSAPPPVEPVLLDEKEDEYKIQVTQAEGALGAVSIKTGTTVFDIPANTPNKLEQLKATLLQISKGREGVKKNAIIKIEAHNDLKYSQLITIIDICRQTGFSSVGVGELPTEAPPAKQ